MTMDKTENASPQKALAAHATGAGSLACPICRQGLIRENHSLQCAKGHAFDLSAKGYVNLLMSQDKHSQDPGDNKEMVQARRRFLDKGFYQPLAEGLSSCVNAILNDVSAGGQTVRLLDAGCGEGYYTGHIRKSLDQFDRRVAMVGMDISKEAIKAAASRYQSVFFAVASLFKLPVADASQDILINCFAPACDSEFRRALSKDGRLVAVIPGKDHLFSFKSLLYETPTRNDEKEPELPSFALESKTVIRDSIFMEDSQTLQDLLTMTPYFWRTPAEGVQRLMKTPSMSTDIEFLILVYRPIA